MSELGTEARIALVDDDRHILTSLAMLLEVEGFSVDGYSDGQVALSAFGRQMPDLAVIDISMPRLDGLDMLQKLRRRSMMPVIFLTARDEEADEILALRLGADDYIRKPFSPRLLSARIRALLRRQTAAQEEDRLVRGDLVMDEACHSVVWRGRPVSLTVTEFMILHTLAQRPGHVRSREQLMDAAYDGEVYVDDRTIDSHIKRIRRKLRQADPAFSAIETLYGIGYRFGVG